MKGMFKAVRSVMTILILCFFMEGNLHAQHLADPLIIQDVDFISANIHDKVRLYQGAVDEVSDLLYLDSGNLIGYHNADPLTLPDSVWVIGTVIRKDSALNSVLISACEQVKYVECYVVRNGIVELYQTSSTSIKNAEREYPMKSSYFRVHFETDTIQFFFLSNIPSNSLKQHYFHVNVFKKSGFVLRLISRLGLQSFYAGLLAVVILIAMFMALQFREQLFIRYALFIFCLGVYFVIQQGLSQIALPSLNFKIDIINQNLFIGLIYLSGFSFVVKQLDLKARSFWMYYSYLVYSLIAAFYATFYRIIPLLAEGYSLFNVFALIWVALTFAIVIHAFVKRVDNSTSTLVSMALLMTGALIYILGELGVLHQSKFARNSFQLGVIGFALSLLYGLFLRIRGIEMTKAMAIASREKSDELLFNVLPEDVAEELKTHGKSDAKSITDVSIIFTDFKGFTELSEQMTAEELVHELHECFVAFDQIVHKYNLEKIKTIGDSYMAAGGLNMAKESVEKTVMAALEMSVFIDKRFKDKSSKGLNGFQMRIGIHTGKVVAGIVGIKKFQYDIWGDTVNTASRMESHGEVGKVNISQATYELIKDDPQFTFEHRGKIEAKGKGEVEMYFVSLA